VDSGYLHAAVDLPARLGLQTLAGDRSVQRQAGGDWLVRSSGVAWLRAGSGNQARPQAQTRAPLSPERRRHPRSASHSGARRP
jgi:hypothetical protein